MWIGFIFSETKNSQFTRVLKDVEISDIEVGPADHTEDWMAACACWFLQFNLKKYTLKSIY